MRYKILLLLGLLIGCTPVEKPKVDYNKGWIVDKDGERHFYRGEIVLGEEVFCLIHQENEKVFVIKSLQTPNEN
jgi:hypothetical protein|tara:strand:+ start:288 stop:509 length:222 start_codon:yes stop_codon:yes gene_type:complete